MKTSRVVRSSRLGLTWGNGACLACGVPEVCTPCDLRRRQPAARHLASAKHQFTASSCRGQDPGQPGRTARSAQSIFGLRLLRISAVTSWRSTRIWTFFDAEYLAGSVSHDSNVARSNR